MDFSNEYYVRLYVRDTTTWKRLGWNGQCVFVQLIRKIDCTGVLDIDDLEPWQAVVLHTGAPEDAAREGIARCIEYGFIGYNGSQLFDATRSASLRIAPARPRPSFLQRLRIAVFERDGWRCRYCGAEITVDDGHADHVHPRSRGGSDDLSNLVAACAPCNRSKGARTPEEWLQ